MFICRKQNKILQNFCNYFVKYCKWISKRLRNPCTISRNLLFLLLLFKVDIFGFQQTLCRALTFSLSPSLSLSLSLFMLPAFTRFLLNSLFLPCVLPSPFCAVFPFSCDYDCQQTVNKPGCVASLPMLLLPAASAASLLNSFVSKDKLCTVLKLWSRVKWATVKRCQRREQQANGKGKGKGNAGWRMGKQKGQQLSARALALPFSPTLTLSCAYERDCVCVRECGVWEWSVSVDCVQPQPRCWQLLGPLPLLNPREAYRRAGGRVVGSVGQACGLSVGLVGNIAEIVYHVANGCVVIIVTEPKVREGEREGVKRWVWGRQPISLCKKNV